MDNLHQEYKKFLQGNTVRALDNWKNNENLNKDSELALADKNFDRRSEEILKTIKKGRKTCNCLKETLEKHQE